jgi:hypothetical protein
MPAAAAWWRSRCSPNAAPLELPAPARGTARTTASPGIAGAINSCRNSEQSYSASSSLACPPPESPPPPRALDAAPALRRRRFFPPPSSSLEPPSSSSSITTGTWGLRAFSSSSSFCAAMRAARAARSSVVMSNCLESFASCRHHGIAERRINLLDF